MSDAMIVIGFILSMVGGFVTQPYWHYLVPRRRAAQPTIIDIVQSVRANGQVRQSIEHHAAKLSAYAVEHGTLGPTSRVCACGHRMVADFIPPFFTTDRCPMCSSGVERWGN